MTEASFLGAMSFPLRKGSKAYILVSFLNLYYPILSCAYFLLLFTQLPFVSVLRNLKKFRISIL